eukprot:Skav208182  [mRNA]  locus=scaffold2530:252455:261667:+ [translate_table: standard]
MNRSHGRVKVLSQQLVASAASASEDVDLDALAYGFMASSALFAALELGIFDFLSAKELTVQELAQSCNALVASKCLQRSELGSYRNSPNVQKFMVSSSKAYYGDYLKYQMGRLFYARMGQLVPILKGEEHLNYSSWFSDPSVASTYTQAQHNGSLATAKALFKRVPLKGIQQMLDVGGGSGAFSLQAVRTDPGLKATVLELPKELERIRFVELDATEPRWPIPEDSQDLVLMSNAWKVLRSGGRLVVHDFMVDDSKDGPALGGEEADDVLTLPGDVDLGFLYNSDTLQRLGDADAAAKQLQEREQKVEDEATNELTKSMASGAVKNLANHPTDCEWFVKARLGMSDWQFHDSRESPRIGHEDSWISLAHQLVALVDPCWSLLVLVDPCGAAGGGLLESRRPPGPRLFSSGGCGYLFEPLGFGGTFAALLQRASRLNPAAWWEGWLVVGGWQG